jgi:hypothetical protein
MTMHQTMTKVPHAGETYVHQNGGEYQIVCLAKDDDREELLVIHRGEDGSYWSRPIGNFMGLRDGAPRFKKVNKAEAD